ncbi:hypothetical protein TYRP_006004 [Tyrophagus putrescentiae]|nr:hypothetical protein TYRP_006004 [Tyrophagus putrescentiae]
MIFFSLLYTTLFFLVLKNQSNTTAVSNQENEARIVGGNKSAKARRPSQWEHPNNNPNITARPPKAAEPRGTPQ